MLKINRQLRLQKGNDESPYPIRSNDTVKKILYFHHAIGLGGAPRSLANLIEHLDFDEFHPYVVMPKRAGNKSVLNLFSDAGADVIEEKNIRPFNGVNGCACDSWKSRRYALLSAPLTFLAARKHVNRIKPDIVHVNTSVLPFAMAGSRFAHRHTPTVAHIRETVLTNFWGRGLGALNRKFAKYFIGIDQHGLDMIKAPADRSTVIPNFVDKKFFSLSQKEPAANPHYRKIFQCDDDSVLFLFLSRVTHSNGALEWANFLHLYKDQIDPRARFAFCGFEQKPDQYGSKVLQSINKNDKAIAHDFVTDVDSIMIASDIIVSPYTLAHSSRAVIEGAAMGKPAIVTDHRNLREQIIENRTGVIIRLEDPLQVVNQINRLVQDDELRHQMGNEARTFANKKFCGLKNAAQMMEIYRSLLQ